jgi:ABC-type transporter Mla subunit MlaD
LDKVNIELLGNLVIGIIFLLTFLCIYFSAQKPADRVRYAQTSVVLGILGTFTGITLGLWTFDVTSIDSSVPNLLNGLKTAFLTSLAGQIASISINSNRIYGVIYSIIGNKKLSIQKDDAGRPKELDISDIVDALKSIKSSIAGDGETTMLTQIQKMRTNTHDSLSELNSSFKEFSKHMVENTNKAIIEALKEVIRDFNAKINEQFGDNFKQLNQGVEKMVVWQNNYKDFVENSEKNISKMIQDMEQAVTTLNSTATVVEKLSKESQAMTETSNKMAKNTTDAINVINEIGVAIGTLSQLSDKAKHLFPQLEQNVETAMKSATSLVENTNHKITEQVQILDRNYETMRRQIESTVNETAKLLEQQVTKLDEELGKELTKSLTSLGNQLASLSQKFVQDYTPLTSRLKEVVDMGRL